MSSKRPFVVLPCALLLLCMSPTLRAQQPEDELVYKFTVQGIAEPAAAKAMQVALIGHPAVLFCSFIDEADAFKLGSNVPLNHATLKAMLQQQGYVLVGDVHVSNGLILSPTQPSTSTE